MILVVPSQCNVLGGAQMTMKALYSASIKSDLSSIKVLVAKDSKLHSVLQEIGDRNLIVLPTKTRLAFLNASATYVAQAPKEVAVVLDDMTKIVNFPNLLRAGIEVRKGRNINLFIRNLAPSGGRIFRALKRSLIRWSQVKFIANSHFTASRMAAFNERGISAILYPPIDVNRFRSAASLPTSSQFQNLRHRFEHLILCPSRITISQAHNKNLIMLVKVVSRLKSLGINNIGAVLIGQDTSKDGLASKTLLKMAAELGVSDLFYIHSPAREIAPYYANSDLVVFPAIDEPFGRVAMEALAMEKPIIGSRSGGILECLQDVYPDLLVEPSDVDGFTEQVIKVTQGYTKNSDVGLKWVCENCNADDYLHKFIEIVNRPV
jgi:glycosyltransferase involved in cell wall biosynthesis